MHKNRTIINFLNKSFLKKFIVGHPFFVLRKTVVFINNKYSLTNFYVSSGLTQFLCVIIIVVVSLYTKPKKNEEIVSLIWSGKLLKLPANEAKRPIWQSVWLWWCIMVILYAIFYYMWW